MGTSRKEDSVLICDVMEDLMADAVADVGCGGGGGGGKGDEAV